MLSIGTAVRSVEDAMPKFQNGDASIHYELIGSGPPLLLIAGIASDGASWGPLIPLLADRFRLVLVDNRGCGRTRVDGVIEIHDIVSDCASLLDHLTIDRAAVVGHSMGGMIGRLLALDHPSRVSRVVTLAAGGAIGPRERALFHDLAQVYLTNPPQVFFRLLYPWLFSQRFFADPRRVADAAEASVLYPHRQAPADFARQVAAVDRMARGDPAAIACPLLAIVAADDILVTPGEALAATEGIMTLQTLIVPDAAHSVHWEAPQQVAEAIRGFLAS